MNMFKLTEKEITAIHKILIRPGGVIAFPTDTVWGMGCLINNKDAVDKIYRIKSRSRNKPLILLGSKN